MKDKNHNTGLTEPSTPIHPDMYIAGIHSYTKIGDDANAVEFAFIEVDEEEPDEEVAHVIDNAIFYICGECYKAGATITFEELVAQVCWLSGHKKSFCEPAVICMTQTLAALVGPGLRTEDILISTCIVDEDGLPRSAYFKYAMMRGLMSSGAATHEKLLFWLETYKRTAASLPEPDLSVLPNVSAKPF